MSKALAERRPSEIALPRYDEMCRAIAACHRVDEAKTLRDKAAALRAYAKQANNRNAEVQFAEITQRAARKAGELLKNMAETGERDNGKGNRNPDLKSQSATPNLESLGLDKHEASRFQQLAAIPEKKFEAALAEARETQQPITSASLRSLTRQPNFTPAQRTEHERLWRVLRALEQIAQQDIPPEQWLAELPDYMTSLAHEHMERARPWLEQLFTEWEKKHAN